MAIQGGVLPVFARAGASLAALSSAALALCALTLPAAAAERTVAVFDFELIDTSLEGEIKGIDPAQTARLARLGPELRAAIEAEPGLRVLDVAPVAERAKAEVLNRCERCAIELGKALGADIVVVGTVQKVSNLILNINAYGHLVATGETVAQGSADIRGNTDEMWVRGIAALWRNTLKKQFVAVEARP